MYGKKWWVAIVPMVRSTTLVWLARSAWILDQPVATHPFASKPAATGRSSTLRHSRSRRFQEAGTDGWALGCMKSHTTRGYSTGRLKTRARPTPSLADFLRHPAPVSSPTIRTDRRHPDSSSTSNNSNSNNNHNHRQQSPGRSMD